MVGFYFLLLLLFFFINSNGRICYSLLLEKLYSLHGRPRHLSIILQKKLPLVENCLMIIIKFKI